MTVSYQFRVTKIEHRKFVMLVIIWGLLKGCFHTKDGGHVNIVVYGQSDST